MTLIQSLLVILAIIGFGVFCQKKKILNEIQIEGFEVFLFKIAIPCYLFASTVNNDLTVLLDVDYILSYASAFLGMAIIMTIAFYKSQTTKEICIHILSSSYVNAAIYVLPVITFLLRDPTAGILGNLVQVVCLQPIMVTILSYFSHKDKSIIKTVKTILTTPLIMFPVVGLTCNYFNLIPPIVVTGVIQSLGDGASSIALFSFGLTLASVGLNKQFLTKKLAFIVIGKNILHPLVAFLVGKYIFQLEAYWLYSLVIATSAPTAFVIYIISKNFGVEPEAVKRVVAISSMMSLISLILIASALG